MSRFDPTASHTPGRTSNGDTLYVLSQVWVGGSEQGQKNKGRSENSDTFKKIFSKAQSQTAVMLSAMPEESREPSNKFQHSRSCLGGGKDDSNRFLQVPINPNASGRIMWDICSLFVVIYEMVTIPLLFFELDDEAAFNAFTLVAAWATRFFWTVDIPLSLLTGWVNPAGNVVMDFRMVGKKYLRTWFLLDFVIVGSDWAELGFLTAAGAELASGADYAQFGRASRTLRILRMLRLLRMLRMQETFSVMAERFQSDNWGIAGDVLKVLFVLLGLSHFIACIWYGLGSSSIGAWVEAYGLVGQSFALRYTLSLHWSLAQFAGGMDEVTAANAKERVFLICIFLLGFILASLFLSVITSSMTEGYLHAAHRSQQISVLRRYLSQNKISKQLTMRVQRNAVCTMTQQQQQTPEAAVELLELISEPLRVELHFETYAPFLAAHPFFASLSDECPHIMRRVCHNALQTQAVAAGDVIFSMAEIEKTPMVYFVCSGDLEYRSFDGEVTQVAEGDWVAEASLWTSWFHRGQLSAVTEARLLLLDVWRFHDFVVQFKYLEFDPRVYGGEFIQKLNNAAEQDVTDLSGCTRLDGSPQVEPEVVPGPTRRRIAEASKTLKVFRSKTSLSRLWGRPS